MQCKERHFNDKNMNHWLLRKWINSHKILHLFNWRYKARWRIWYIEHEYFRLKSHYLTKQYQDFIIRASLLVQWLRIRLPMQGTRVRALVREDPTCRGATKPVRHNYWACALEPACHNYGARAPQLLSLCSRAHEPQLPSPHATTTEACTPRARALQQEKPPGFPGGAVVENLPANAGDTGSSPGLWRSHMPQRN